MPIRYYQPVAEAPAPPAVTPTGWESVDRPAIRSKPVRRVDEASEAWKAPVSAAPATPLNSEWANSTVARARILARRDGPETFAPPVSAVVSAPTGWEGFDRPRIPLLRKRGADEDNAAWASPPAPTPPVLPLDITRPFVARARAFRPLDDGSPVIASAALSYLDWATSPACFRAKVARRADESVEAWNTSAPPIYLDWAETRRVARPRSVRRSDEASESFALPPVVLVVSYLGWETYGSVVRRPKARVQVWDAEIVGVATAAPQTIPVYYAFTELDPAGHKIFVLQAQAPKAQFFDATGYTGGIGHGIPKFSWANDFQLLTNGQADQTKVNAAADSAMAASGFLAFDIETISVNADDSSPSQAQAEAAILAALPDLAHARQPSLRAGFWSPYPVSVNGFEHQNINVPHWQSLDDLVSSHFANCDWGAFQVYHAFDGTDGYADFATKTAAELRRLFPNKPIYAVVWPYLNESGSNPAANLPIDQGTWAFILSTVISKFDAVIIWGGYGAGDGEPNGGALDPNSPWLPAILALL